MGRGLAALTLMRRLPPVGNYTLPRRFIYSFDDLIITRVRETVKGL
jgi:hypothetical protein